MRTIFVLGIGMRSGTNFVHDLIKKHTSCRGVAEVWEDYVLPEVAHLDRCAEGLERMWAEYPLEKTRLDGFRAKLGGAVKWLLETQYGGEEVECAVTKTPSFRGLEYIREFFPEEKFVLVVRDPRALVYSFEKSFGGEYFHRLDAYRDGARRLKRFSEAHPEFYQKNCMVVKYEELVGSLEEAMPPVLRFLGLSEEGYDFGAADSMPVRGSSETRKSQEEVTWEPREKSKDFDPLNRWRAWPEWKIAYCDWYLGKEMEFLGYAGEGGGGGLALVVPKLRHLWSKLGRLWERLRRRLG